MWTDLMLLRWKSSGTVQFYKSLSRFGRTFKQKFYQPKKTKRGSFFFFFFFGPKAATKKRVLMPKASFEFNFILRVIN